MAGIKLLHPIKMKWNGRENNYTEWDVWREVWAIGGWVQEQERRKESLISREPTWYKNAKWSLMLERGITLPPFPPTSVCVCMCICHLFLLILISWKLEIFADNQWKVILFLQMKLCILWLIETDSILHSHDSGSSSFFPTSSAVTLTWGQPAWGDRVPQWAKSQLGSFYRSGVESQPW